MKTIPQNYINDQLDGDISNISEDDIVQIALSFDNDESSDPIELSDDNFEPLMNVPLSIKPTAAWVVGMSYQNESYLMTHSPFTIHDSKF